MLRRRRQPSVAAEAKEPMGNRFAWQTHAAIQGWTVRLTLPPGATYQGSTGSGWTCTPNGSKLTCTHPPLTDGESEQVQVQVQVPGTPGTITTTTTISSTGSDPDGANNTVKTTTCLKERLAMESLSHGCGQTSRFSPNGI